MCVGVFYECSISVHPLGGILHQSLLRFLCEFMELLYPALGFGYDRPVKHFDRSCAVLI